MNPLFHLKNFTHTFLVPWYLPMYFVPMLFYSCLSPTDRFCVCHFLSLKKSFINMRHIKIIHYLVLVLSYLKHLATYCHHAVLSGLLREVNPDEWDKIRNLSQGLEFTQLSNQLSRLHSVFCFVCLFVCFLPSLVQG